MTRQRLDIDLNHSTLEFAVTYAMNSIVKGRFQDFSGSLDFDADNPTDSRVSIQVSANSVSTGVETRDNHLRSADFFDAGSYHDLSFDSTNVAIIGDKRWKVTGDLSMAGITRSVDLDTRYFGTVEDATGVTRAGFVAEADILRSDWGLVWNEEQETGVLVSDRVRLSLYISAIPSVSIEPDDSFTTTEIPEEESTTDSE